jgi:hypothetical protein
MTRRRLAQRQPARRQDYNHDVKRALILAALAAAAFLAYRYAGSAHGAAKRYQEFAEAILHRDYDAAALMTDGLDAQQLGRSGSQERIGAGPAMFQTLFPSRFRIESEEKADDGTVTLHAVQTVLFNPVGVESAIRPAMYAKLRQTVRLAKRGSEWKVTSFENAFQEMDSLSTR